MSPKTSNVNKSENELNKKYGSSRDLDGVKDLTIRRRQSDVPTMGKDLDLSIDIKMAKKGKKEQSNSHDSSVKSRTSYYEAEQAMDMELNEKSPSNRKNIYEGEFEIKIPRQVSQPKFDTEELLDYPIAPHEKYIQEGHHNRESRALHQSALHQSAIGYGDISRGSHANHRNHHSPHNGIQNQLSASMHQDFGEHKKNYNGQGTGKHTDLRGESPHKLSGNGN